MFDYKLALPTNDADGLDLSDTHSDLVKELVDEFGSCKASSYVAFYRGHDNDEYRTEDGYEYSFTCKGDKDSLTTAGSTDFIHSLAVKYGKLCKLEHVHVTYPSGENVYVEVK